MYRITPNGQEPIIDAYHVEAIEPAIRASEPGRYHIHELGADPLPSGHRSRRWGAGRKVREGAVAIEPDPWPE